MSKTKLQYEFEQFHAKNPEVYELFDRYVKELIARGHKKHSVRAIIYRIHWHMEEFTPAKVVHVRDNMTPYYARLWLKNNPKHHNFFKTLPLSTKALADD